MQVVQDAVGPAHVGANGAVNFESNLIPTSVEHQTSLVEAVAVQENVGLGNSRELVGGGSPVVVVASISKEEPEDTTLAIFHTTTLAIHLTLNTGFTVLKGHKELRAVEVDGEKFNFYNPFVKADKDRLTGEGLMRKVLGTIAKLAHTVLGRECVYFGNQAETEGIRKMSAAVGKRIASCFPVPPHAPVTPVNITLANGTSVTRDILFEELFALNSWESSDHDEETGVITHTVHLNFSLNAAALYDSNEPHAFVMKAYSFLESQLTALGLNEVVEYYVNYAFDASTLEDSEVRDTLELLVGEEHGYSVVSKAGVVDGRYSWIPPTAADALFGFGCDLILQSPTAEVEDEDEAE
jgi:hypothetical protein